MEQPRMALGWAARDTSGLLSPLSFPLRPKGDEDVVVKILFCGICHSDLSTIKNEWGNAKYPVIPGHEIVGVVAEVGSRVTRFKAGDNVGAGYIASSCRACPSCHEGFENYCPGLVPSFNSALPDGAKVHGGFSELAVVHEHFVVRIPDASSPLDRVAPLLCAGVTVYCPMRRLGLDGPGLRLGVAGLGGLGHLAVKFGKALGMKVTVISTSPGKRAEAVERLGADEFLLSTDAEQMKAARGTMDGIIDTVSAAHDLTPLIMLLRTHGKLVPVGSPGTPVQLALFPLQSGGKMVAGSMIGGMRDTQETIDFAAEHGITAEVEVIGVQDVNAAMERLRKGDVRYRFVIDVANTMTRSHQSVCGSFLPEKM